MIKDNDNLILGQKVKFSLVTYFEYDDDKYKKKEKESFKAEIGIIVRKTKKATGYYSDSVEDFDGEWSPPCLKVDKWHDVYEVAYCIREKTILVSPEDLEIIEDK